MKIFLLEKFHFHHVLCRCGVRGNSWTWFITLIHQFCHWKFTYHCFPLSNTFCRAFLKHLPMKNFIFIAWWKTFARRIFIVAFFLIIFIIFHSELIPGKIDKPSTVNQLMYFTFYNNNAHINPFLEKFSIVGTVNNWLGV